MKVPRVSALPRLLFSFFSLFAADQRESIVIFVIFAFHEYHRLSNYYFRHLHRRYARTRECLVRVLGEQPLTRGWAG